VIWGDENHFPGSSPLNPSPATVLKLIRCRRVNNFAIVKKQVDFFAPFDGSDNWPHYSRKTFFAVYSVAASYNWNHMAWKHVLRSLPGRFLEGTKSNEKKNLKLKIFDPKLSWRKSKKFLASRIEIRSLDSELSRFLENRL
jgi:hypothetical protein